MQNFTGDFVFIWKTALLLGGAGKSLLSNTRESSRKSTPFGLYAPSGAPGGRAAAPFGAPEGGRAVREAPVRRPSVMLREGETAGTV